MRAFISYVDQDYGIVSRLAQELKLNGIDVWFDKTRLKPGQIWTTEIRNAIKSGDHLSRASLIITGIAQIPI